jgi:hypothetical protein
VIHQLVSHPRFESQVDGGESFDNTLDSHHISYIKNDGSLKEGSMTSGVPKRSNDIFSDFLMTLYFLKLFVLYLFLERKIADQLLLVLVHLSKKKLVVNETRVENEQSRNDSMYERAQCVFVGFVRIVRGRAEWLRVPDEDEMMGGEEHRDVSSFDCGCGSNAIEDIRHRFVVRVVRVMISFDTINQWNDSIPSQRGVGESTDGDVLDLKWYGGDEREYDESYPSHVPSGPQWDAHHLFSTLRFLLLEHPLVAWPTGL